MAKFKQNINASSNWFASSSYRIPIYDHYLNMVQIWRPIKGPNFNLQYNTDIVCSVEILAV